MKRVLSLTLTISMLITMFVGCAKRDTTSDNTITVNASYGYANELIEAMIKALPEINFEVNWYVGDNPANYQLNRVRNDDASDIITYPNFTDLEADTSRMLDLSGYSFIGNINDEVLNVMNVNGGIYQIPSNLEVRCVAYNKTLFAENGWEAPSNYDELISLIKQIRTDKPDITPIAMGALPIFNFNMISTMSQASYLITGDGQKWEESFFKGEGSIADGFADGFTMMEGLLDAGAFNFEAGTGKTQLEDEMVNRKAAMYAVWVGTQDLLDAFDGKNTTDEIGLLPYFGLNGEDTIVGYRSTVMWSLNKNLAKKGNEKKLENALKVMEWFLSDEAQSINQAQISVTNDNKEIDPRVAELMQLAEGGYQEHTLYMGYEHIIPNMGQIVQQAVLSGSSKGMREKVVATVDTVNKSYVANAEGNAGIQISGDCNDAQTAQIVADILYSSGVGDFALVTHTGVKNDSVNNFGASGNFYDGGLILSDMTSCVMGIKNNLSVETVKLTGAEVMSLLENGKMIGEEAFPYYWSGIDVSLKNGKVASAKLGGTELEDNAVYTVVFAPKDYPAAYAKKAESGDKMLLSLVQTYFNRNPKVEAPKEQRK